MMVAETKMEIETGINERVWDIGQELYEATRDNEEEKRIYNIAKGLPGMDRHSYLVVMATPEQVEEHGFLEYETYPGSNIVKSRGLPLDNPNLDYHMRQIRNKEGVCLLEYGEESSRILRNGVKLPDAKEAELLEEFGVRNLEDLTDKLNLDEEVGGKALASLLMSMRFKDLTFARLDGRNYLLKAGSIYDLEDPNGLYNPLQLFS